MESPEANQTGEATAEAVRKFHRARWRVWTVAAVVVGLAHWVLLGLAISHPILTRHFEAIQPLVLGDVEYGWAILGALAVVCELILNGVETIVRYRSPRRRRVVPLTWVPLGRTARMLLFWGVELFLCLPKVLVYLLVIALIGPLRELAERFLRLRQAPLGWSRFLWVPILSTYVLPPIFLALVLSSGFGAAAQLIGLAELVSAALVALDVDRYDDRIEPIERVAVWLYNRLYYTQVEPGGGIFSVVFNTPLWMWSFHHG